MKIILTGCTGTGKTTLGLHLQESGLVERYIQEDWSWAKFTEDSDEARSKTLEASMHWYTKRAEIIQDSNSSFAMDRGPMDILHYWAILRYASPQAWKKLSAKSCALLRKVDLIVFFPWQSRSSSSLPPSANEDGLTRRMGGYSDVLVQSMLLGITHQLAPTPKILMLPRQLTTESRADLIMKRIAKLQAMASSLANNSKP